MVLCFFQQTAAEQNGDKQKGLQFSDNRRRLPQILHPAQENALIASLYLPPSLFAFLPSLLSSFSTVLLFRPPFSLSFSVFLFCCSSQRRRAGRGGYCSSCLLSSLLCCHRNKGMEMYVFFFSGRSRQGAMIERNNARKKKTASVKSRKLEERRGHYDIFLIISV